MTDQADNVTRREAALECMRWAGGGVLWSVIGGIPRGSLISAAAADTTAFTFAQVSDSHLGFARDPNMDTSGTFQLACDEVRAMPQKPRFMIHTGDVSHLSKSAEFDAASQIMGSTGLQAFTVPGEHDILDENAYGFAQRFQKGQPDGGYFSFDQEGVHFIGLNNVGQLSAGGMGALGDTQLAWFEADLKSRAASQPVVVFAHIPLWTVAPEWGWGTADAARALTALARFGSVTVLNGHIHQVIQKVEGHVAFHTARSTAFPQPAPGTAPSPGPMKVPAGQLRSVLGVASVSLVPGQSSLAIIDTPLGA